MHYFTHPSRRILYLLVLIASTGPGIQPAHSQEKTIDTTRTIAALIGVHQYKNVSQLKYIQNDISRLGDILQDRGGLDRGEIYRLADVDHPMFTSSKKNVVRVLEEAMKKAQPTDTLLIYFSGHGFRGKDGQLYLAPNDCRLDALEESSIPIQWLRDGLAQCQAGFTLLVIDACHAGAEESSVVAHDLGQPLGTLPNVVTLCSSTGDQKSQIWEEKQQSLFSYWLCQGLRGNADDNSDGAVDIDELYKYVHDHVVRSGKKRLGREQTPVRSVRTGTSGVPVVLKLEPLSLDQVLDDLADQIVWAAEENELKRMAVLEFMEDSALGKVLGAKFGVLGRYCAAELQERLTRLGAGDFRVADQSRIENALHEQEFQIDDLGNDNALQTLSDKVGGLSALSLGSFHSRVNRDIGVRCRLVSVKTGDVLSVAGGMAKLSDSEWGMLGGSGWIPPEKRPRTPPARPRFSDDRLPREAREGNSRREDASVRELDLQTAHPLRDPRFPFNVKLVVDGRERRGEFKSNPETGKEDYVVTFRHGEVYSIWVENKSRRIACCRLLVDGLNTLPEKSQTKGIAVLETAPRVNLATCRAWILDPFPPGKRPQTVWAVDGFFTNTGKDGQLREFKVTDADASVAARRGFTDQVGLITAAFYHKQEPIDASSGLDISRGPAGTDFGLTRDAETDERKHVVPGDLWGIVNIRYVLED